MEKTFTVSELKNFDGKKGHSAYVAYKGKVYDVTSSFHWKGGVHWVVHKAGTDLTAEMDKAPHFDDLLLKYPVVGVLV
jgi:predicted heme/steroid binding protein